MPFSNDLQDLISTGLRPLENNFKSLYLKYPERQLSSPHRLEEVRDIIDLADKDTNVFPTMLFDPLQEDDYIQPDVDIAIYQHIRYMPANWHTHRFFEIACVLRGTITHFILNQEIALTPGDICIVAPNTAHAVSAFSDDCVMLNILLRAATFENSFFSLLSDNDLLTGFFTHALCDASDTSYLLFKTGDDPALQGYITSLHREFKRSLRYKKNMMNAILSAFFILLMRNHEKDVIIPTVSQSVMTENLIFMLHYLQENYTRITLQQLADFFNYSPRHVQRILTTATGRSFSETVLTLKMKHAADFLKGPLTVSEIAERLGYYDASSFRHAFKEYYAMTPNEYRARLPG